MMKGNHWDVFALQGFHRTWYAGASVCFESVKSVMEYNNLLLRQSLYQELPLPTPDGKVSTTVDHFIGMEQASIYDEAQSPEKM